MAKTISEKLVEVIDQAGIKHIYAVTGDSLNHVNDAIRRQDNIKWVHVRHEEVGAYAAMAEAQLNGIGCCAGSSGPGHVHLINGLYDAYHAGSAVLAIASACPSTETGTAYFQETNTIKLFDDCSSYNQIANTPVQFNRMLQTALQTAIHKQTVSVIGLPGDLTNEKAVHGPTAEFALPSKSVYYPAKEELNDFANLINSSEKITIFCGIGAKDAHAELIALADKIKSPIGYTFRGKMAIQYNNPYEVGLTGLLGLPSAYTSMHESDLLILLGTDFPYHSFMPTDCKIVQVDIQPERIGRRAKVDLGLGGDVKDTLTQLLPLIENKTNRDFLDKQLKIYSKVKDNLHNAAVHTGEKNKIAPEFIASTISKLADKDAIFTIDTGMCCVWGARYLEATGQREMLGSFSHGSMANAMPMAIGAAFARPDQQVIAFCGDGGLSMLMGDLATIAQYKLPIKLVVFNNRALGMVKLEMEVSGLPDYETNMVNPDFAAVGAAMGIKSFTIDDPANAEETLKNALQLAEPVLINVMTDPNALAMPPKVELAQMVGFAQSMVKLIAMKDFDEVWNTVTSNLKHYKDLL